MGFFFFFLHLDIAELPMEIHSKFGKVLSRMENLQPSNNFSRWMQIGVVGLVPLAPSVLNFV
jgi:hypothetical protein